LSFNPAFVPDVNFYLGLPGIGGVTSSFYNSGFNYNPYVQYDDFGAVVQVRHVPVFYDYYGRVNRIGSVFISYRNGRLFRLGGMRVYYNPHGYYSYHAGYINTFNRYYVYSPFHRYFVRPAVGYCMVYPQPYRRYYQPVRYTYHRPYHHNVRRAYARVGQPHRYQKRVERSRVYRNDSRVVARSSRRSGDLVRNSRESGNRNLRQSSRSGRSATVERMNNGQKEVNRSSRKVVRNEGTSATQRTSRVSTRKTNQVVRSPKRQALTSRPCFMDLDAPIAKQLVGDMQKTRKACTLKMMSRRNNGRCPHHTRF